ncbi:hypothetical protein STCU_10096 [Strigomonas culicis]|uniref:BRCT domain-containing protein n=1 Tax=Strigomonas culicis TaxID=28005 RepID=S9TP83_9TRYP|nr:hypothetical protein STCU_10096 [Strigomonas culicis]|eukprot:EPY18253.1 hypothetical protein STCU_10096 [Strigomonas culicis]
MLESESDTEPSCSFYSSSTEAGDSNSDGSLDNEMRMEKSCDCILFARCHFTADKCSTDAATDCYGTTTSSLPLRMERHVRRCGEDRSFQTYVDVGRSLFKKFSVDATHEKRLLPFMSRHQARLVLTFKPSRCGATPFYCETLSIVALARHVSFRSTPLLPHHRYRFRVEHGQPSICIDVMTKCTLELSLTPNTDFSSLAGLQLQLPAAVSNPVTTTRSTQLKRQVKASATSSTHKFVAYTTGMRLTASEEARCKRLGLLLNPNLKRAAEAQVLIVGDSLIRSIKLLSVLPHIRAIVKQEWLAEVMRTKSTSVAFAPYIYEASPPLHQSVETLNQFKFEELLAVPSAARRCLFSDQVFWVHKSVVPQEPPLNDVKTVLTSSGGTITRHLKEATVLIVPQKRPRGEHWEDAALSEALHTHSVATVDDIFRSIFQQVKVFSSPSEEKRFSRGVKVRAKQKAV